MRTSVSAMGSKPQLEAESSSAEFSSAAGGGP